MVCREECGSKMKVVQISVDTKRMCYLFNKIRTRCYNAKPLHSILLVTKCYIVVWNNYFKFIYLLVDSERAVL